MYGNQGDLVETKYRANGHVEKNQNPIRFCFADLSMCSQTFSLSFGYLGITAHHTNFGNFHH